ncbi:MAG: fliO [Noviherbaspirillum sp.]|jgi:flagellar protein FliO/FliZ|nr:fliO [Noviherbaspirillum sp.]
MRRLVPLPYLLAAGAAGAAEQAGPVSAGSLIQVVIGLLVVLALMAGAAWLLRRFGLSRVNTPGSIKIVGGVNVGTRERVMVVEVADQWIVVGVAPGRVNALATMARQEAPALPDGVPGTAPVAKNFSAWLKQTIEKRNGQ